MFVLLCLKRIAPQQRIVGTVSAQTAVLICIARVFPTPLLGCLNLIPLLIAMGFLFLENVQGLTSGSQMRIVLAKVEKPAQLGRQ